MKPQAAISSLLNKLPPETSHVSLLQLKCQTRKANCFINCDDKVSFTFFRCGNVFSTNFHYCHHSVPFYVDNIHLALSICSLGLPVGLAIVPVAAGYAFTKYGFSTTMLLIVPFLSLHLISGVTYVQSSSQQNMSEEKEQKDDIASCNSNIDNNVLRKVIGVLLNAKVSLNL